MPFSTSNAFRNTACHGLALNTQLRVSRGIFLRAQVCPDNLSSLQQHKGGEGAFDVERKRTVRVEKHIHNVFFGLFGCDLQAELQINATLRDKSKHCGDPEFLHHAKDEYVMLIDCVYKKYTHSQCFIFSDRDLGKFCTSTKITP